MASTPAKQPWNVVGGATLFSRGEAQRFARQIVESESYRETVQNRAKTGTLPQSIEAMLWYYAYGKPIEQVHMTLSPGEEDLGAMSVADLQRRAREIADELAEAEALEQAIDLEPGVQSNVQKGPWQP